MSFKTPKDQSIELEVNNFGPIVNANIDLRPLTVFVGPSNTGKSYLAILIYALQKFFSERGVGLDLAYGRYRLRRKLGNQLRTDETIAELLSVAKLLMEDIDAKATSSIVLSPNLSKVLATCFNEYGNVLLGRICRCFGLEDPQFLIRKGTSRFAEVIVRKGFIEGDEHFRHELKLGATTELSTNLPCDVPIKINPSVDFWYGHLVHYFEDASRDINAEKPSRHSIARLLSFVAELLVPPAVGTMHSPIYYLPADRTGIMHAHHVVVSALIESATSAGIRQRATTPVLTGVLADFLDQMVQLDFIRRRRSAVNSEVDLGLMIEEKVLTGSVKVVRSKTVNYPHFAYRPTGWDHDLSLSNASSMVSELAPVVLYLRHVVEAGNVLIIEEPESHLHPAKQVELTRQLANLVNAGIRVIVTTHSEWLLEELANIVRRSSLPKQKLKDLTSKEVVLHPQQVGTWLFTPKSRPKGSVVEEIQLNDSGLYPSDYDAVSIALHNDWAEIESGIEN
ncbi:MAG: AAA family ATPase [Gammaproteobacteria bacterium]|nr:AAA family ATPase [Gammaproteobacteria bacterium]